MITLAQLQPFCTEAGIALSKPFRIVGDRIAATNGRIIVWAAAADIVDVATLGEDHPHAPKIDEAFLQQAANLPGEWHNLPANLLPAPEEYVDCPECRGNGKVYWHYKGHTELYDCPECEGEGVVPGDRDEQPVVIAGARFKPTYLRRLAQLPGPVQVRVTGRNTIAEIRFDGGRGHGLIVPLRGD